MGGIYLFSSCSSHLFAMQTNRFGTPILARFSGVSKYLFPKKTPKIEKYEDLSVRNGIYFFI
jgi:hypothetical protein